MDTSSSSAVSGIDQIEVIQGQITSLKLINENLLKKVQELSKNIQEEEEKTEALNAELNEAESKNKRYRKCFETTSANFDNLFVELVKFLRECKIENHHNPAANDNSK